MVYIVHMVHGGFSMAKSLLEKIQRKNEVEKTKVGIARSENESTAGQQLKIPAGQGSCSVCDSVLAWLDIYGGGPYCHRCRPWPSETFIRALIGYDAAAARWRTIWPRDGSQDQTAGARDSCEHLVTRKRVVWPIVEDRSRIAIDFDRAAEVETFLECLACGEWIREPEP